MLGGKGLQQILLFVRILLIARLLPPSEVGLMGVALVTLAFLEVLTATGFSEALISKGERIGEYLHPAWTLLAVRGAIIALLVVAGAPQLAAFAGDVEATHILQIAALGVLLQGLSSPMVPRLWVDLKVGRLMICETVAVFVDLTVTVILAWVWADALAMAIGYVLGRLTYSIATYIAAPAVPRLDFTWAKMAELYRFGRWIGRSQLIVFGYSQADALFVSHLMGTYWLAVHQVAQRLSLTPVRQFTAGLGQVLFPAFSRLKENPSARVELMVRALAINCGVMVPLTFTMMMFSEPITHLILGKKWFAASPVMVGAAILMLPNCVNALFGGLLMSLSRPDIATKFQLFKLVVLLTSIIPLTLDSGVLGAILAACLGELLATPLHLHIVCRLAGIPRRRLLLPIGLPIVMGGVSVLVAHHSTAAIGLGLIPGFIVALVLIAALYAQLMLFVAPRLGLDLWREIDFIRGAIAARGNPTAPPRAEPPTSKADTSSD